MIGAVRSGGSSVVARTQGTQARTSSAIGRLTDLARLSGKASALPDEGATGTQHKGQQQPLGGKKQEHN